MSDAGEKIVTYLECDLPRSIMCGHLSKRTHYTLHITGPASRRELENLIKLVQAQISVLDGEDDQEPTS